jgi:hypothetical protein
MASPTFDDRVHAMACALMSAERWQGVAYSVLAEMAIARVEAVDKALRARRRRQEQAAARNQNGEG